MLDKTGIRTYIKEVKKNKSPEFYKIQSQEIIKKIEALPQFCNSQIIAMYWPLPMEVDLTALIIKYSKSKTILLPVIRDNDIYFCPFENENQMKRNRYNILEPISTPYLELKNIETIIVPGIAFDQSGNRLGRGKGYYDRFLASSKAFKIGVCVDFQLIDNIPTQAHDVKMDIVIFG